VAGPPSGDRPAQSTNGSIEGQQESARASKAPQDDQALADREQTLSDADQTGSDGDQTLSDADQTSSDKDQLAAERDQAAADRDLASGVDPRAHEVSEEMRERTARQRDRTARQRDQTAQTRLEAAARRDEIAQTRDRAAQARDHAADARNLASGQRDDASKRADESRALTGADVVMRAADQRKRAAAYRTQAADQRAQAAQDRERAAQDREQGARERLRALADREALADQRVVFETDVLTGAHTRAAGLTDLDHELDRCRETSGELVVAAVTLRASEGDAAGDEMLERVVALIKEHLRSFDLIIRLADDELVCAMPSMTLLHARRRFDAIATAFAGGPDGGAIRTGFAELAPGDSATALIARADGRRAVDDHPSPADVTNVNPA
jgi:GGDEF domain-containing protein